MNKLDKMREELKRLRATISAAHNFLHQGNVDAAHEALHCGKSHAEAKQNIAVDDASKLQVMAEKFNHFCQANDIDACWVALVPSATREGFVSMQIGGCVEVVNHVRTSMGLPPTIAVGDHK